VAFIEFRGKAVAEKRNRWMINTVLVLAVLAFVGFSLFPILTEAFKPPTATTAASPTPGGPVDKKKLEDEARGYASVVEREPDNQIALRGLIEAKSALGDFAGTIAPLEKLKKLNPDDSQYAILLAQVKQRTGDREGAAQAYREILTSKPGDTLALQGFVNLQIQEKRPEAAISLLQETLAKAPQLNKNQPGSVDALALQLLLGSVYANQERYADAISIYDEAAKANKVDFRPVIGKAIVLKAQGKIDEAKPLFAAAVNMAPPQFKDEIKRLADAPVPGASPTTAPSPGASPSSSPEPAATSTPSPAPSDKP
jgi:tetratricopeptide (TPR) repeat protein